MKLVKRLIKLFFFVVALLLLAVLVFVATFDANNYKPQIIEQAEKATGRDFTINGDIVLSVFPWIGLKVEDIALGNEKGFKAEQFAAIKQLDVKVNVLPLLKKEVQINTIRLHGLDVSLEIAEDKSNNWSSLSQADGAAETDEAASEQEEQKTGEAAIEEEQGASVLQSLKVEGFEFVDAIIRYDDESSNAHATVSELNLTTSAIEFDQPVNIEFGAHIKNSEPEIDTRLELTTQLVFNKDFSEFNLSGLVFTVLAKANEFIKQDEKIEIKSNIDVSMDEQRIILKQLQIAALGINTQADVNVSQFLQTPLIQSDFEIQPFNAVEVAKRVGVELPVMAKADALQHVALKTKIKLQGEKLQANDFSLSLDGSVLTGWLHIINISKQQLRYDLAFDQLNINDYLPPVSAEVAGTAGAAGAEKPGATADVTSADVTATGDEKIELPVEMMRQLDVQGDFRIAALVVKEYNIKQFLMSVKAEKGAIAIKPLSMQVLEGQVGSTIKLNVQKAKPAYAINLDVNQVQVGPVANPFLKGAMGEKELTLKGAMNLAMDVKTTGDSVNQLKQGSKGKIVFDMKQTEVKGFDPEFYMRSSVADYVHEKGFGLSKTIMGKYKPREVTVFDKIHSTVNLANGKADTNDFLMNSKRVKVTAKGHVDIMQDTLDVTSSIKLPRAKTAAEKIFNEPVFVRVHGPFAALEYDIDTDRLKKSTSNVLQNEAKAKLEEEKQRLKEKAKEKSDKELKRAEKKAKQKLEDKLKDKLKSLF